MHKTWSYFPLKSDRKGVKLVLASGLNIIAIISDNIQISVKFNNEHKIKAFFTVSVVLAPAIQAYDLNSAQAERSRSNNNRVGTKSIFDVTHLVLISLLQSFSFHFLIFVVHFQFATKHCLTCFDFVRFRPLHSPVGEMF